MPELANNEQDIIYDRFGAARLRILINDLIITWDGAHVGFLDGIAPPSCATKPNPIQ